MPLRFFFYTFQKVTCVRESDSTYWAARAWPHRTADQSIIILHNMFIGVHCNYFTSVSCTTKSAEDRPGRKSTYRIKLILLVIFLFYWLVIKSFFPNITAGEMIDIKPISTSLRTPRCSFDFFVRRQKILLP